MSSIGRRLLTSGNFLLTLALLGTLFILVNFVSSRRYARRDVSTQQLTHLSDQTLQTLKTLEQPVDVIVFYPPAHRLYELVKDLLAEYERASRKIHVEFVDPQQDAARARQLVREFELDPTDPEILSLAIFKSGTRYKRLSDAELAELDYEPLQFQGQPRVRAFKGEEAFTSAILSVTQTERPLIWFTTGHGEKSVEATDLLGLSALTHALEGQNMTVQPIPLLAQPEIPPNVKLIVIAGPTRRFTEQELVLLEGYLQRGGRLLVLLDPLEQTGLDGLLEQWGIEPGLDIVVDPVSRLPGISPANLLVVTYTLHPVVEKMKRLGTLFPLARSMQRLPTPPAGVTVTPLALTSASGWGETRTDVSTFEFNEGQDLRGPVTIAIAAERAGPGSDGQATTKTRVVAIGDSDFAINSQLDNIGNRDLLIGSALWLLEQERLIGISPKPLEAIRLSLTHDRLLGVFWFSLLTLPLSCGLLGAGMWWVRRI